MMRTQIKFITGKCSHGIMTLAVVDLAPDRSLHVEGVGTFKAPKIADPVWRVDWTSADGVCHSERNMVKADAMVFARQIIATEAA